MSIRKLPSGRLQVKVWSSWEKREVPAPPLVGLPNGTTFKTKREAKDIEAKAYAVIHGQGSTALTLADFYLRWTTDPLFARPKKSTNLHNAERVKVFVDRYGPLRLTQITDQVVSEYLAGGKRNRTVPALRAMFNDAKSAKGGRLVTTNPFAELGLTGEKGNKHKQPPTSGQMELMVVEARRLTPPSFAAYLEFACVTGIRPGEQDALPWDAVDFENNEVYIGEQWNAKVGAFTEPKYGPYTVALVDRARQVLMQMPRDQIDSRFVFTTLRGTHYSPASRFHHWNRVRVAAGIPEMTLYLATRHYFGWYSLNVLGLPPHVIAEQLGHKDGGKLVQQLYGHPDAVIAREQIKQAWAATPTRRLRAVGDDG
jgi:integrase